MGRVRGCEIPETLYYDVASNVWARREDDGTVTIGMTSYACSLSGPIVSYTPSKVGKVVKKNKSCATVESGKWVGPVKAPVNGEVLEVNPALSLRPELINTDPYGAGWLLKITAQDWDADAHDLVSGAEALQLFDEKMELDGFGGC